MSRGPRVVARTQPAAMSVRAPRPAGPPLPAGPPALLVPARAPAAPRPESVGALALWEQAPYFKLELFLGKTEDDPGRQVQKPGFDHFSARVRVSGVADPDQRQLLCCMFAARAAELLLLASERSTNSPEPGARVEMSQRDEYNCEIPERAFCEYTVTLGTQGNYPKGVTVGTLFRALVQASSTEFDLGRLVETTKAARQNMAQGWPSEFLERLDNLLQSSDTMEGTFGYSANTKRSREKKGYLFMFFASTSAS